MNQHLTNTFQAHCSVVEIRFRKSKIDLRIDNKQVNIRSSLVFASAIQLLTKKVNINTLTIYYPDDCQKLVTIIDAILKSDLCSVRYINIHFENNLKIDTIDKLVDLVSKLNDNIYHIVMFLNISRQQGEMIRSKIVHHKIHVVVKQ